MSLNLQFPEGQRPDPQRELKFSNMLRDMIAAGASDLHLKVEKAPYMRLDGEMRALPGYDIINVKGMSALIDEIIAPHHQETLKREKELDFAHHVPGLARFRVNAAYFSGDVGMVLRQIPERVPTFDQIGLPPQLRELCKLPQGLILFTGETGSGKTTSLGAMLNEINETRDEHIITIEDPVEIVHTDKRCLIRQREIGSDTLSFSRALISSLREDPDVILVGEMRDPETTQTAITAAETGHLVFGTLHTKSAPSSIDRILGLFEAKQQPQIRMMLSESLAAVVTQRLLPRSDGKGRVAAHEIMIVTTGIRHQIRQGKTHDIANDILTGGRHGMQTMDQALAGLVRAGLVDQSVAEAESADKETFYKLLHGAAAGMNTTAGQSAAHQAQPGAGRVRLPGTDQGGK